MYSYTHIPQGATPTHTFTLPFPTSLIARVKITYSQNDIEVFSKSTTDCSFDGNKIIVTLTQAETLMLNARNFKGELSDTEIQIRVVTTNEDRAVVSKIIKCDTYKALHKGVI